jgi:hypothetical protein
MCDIPDLTMMSIAALAMHYAREARSPTERYREGWERTFGSASPTVSGHDLDTVSDGDPCKPPQERQ